MTLSGRTEFMRPSNTYWSKPENTVTSMPRRLDNDLGFRINIPHRDPVSTPFYYGEGTQNIYGDRKHVFSTLPELHAIDNVMPHTAGFARIDPTSLAARFSRESVTVRA